MDPLLAHASGIDQVDCHRIFTSQWIVPRFQAVPMGWSHAVEVCQTVVQCLIDDAPGPGRDPLFRTSGNVLWSRTWTPF